MNRFLISSGVAPLASLRNKMKTKPPIKVIPLNKKKVPAFPNPLISEPVAMDINRTIDQMAKLESEKPDSVRITVYT
jgi:hypothetical protein